MFVIFMMLQAFMGLGNNDVTAWVICYQVVYPSLTGLFAFYLADHQRPLIWAVLKGLSVFCGITVFRHLIYLGSDLQTYYDSMNEKYWTTFYLFCIFTLLFYIYKKYGRKSI